MRDERNEKGRSGRCDRSTTNRWKILTMGLTLLLIVPMGPIHVGAGTTFTANVPDDPTVIINCSKAVMTTAPKFLSTPKGSAKYPFSMKCTSGERAGIMLFTWEGRWNPSETRQDRPNAVETLNIEGWEPFIPGRTGGKLFMFWTARCTADPWLQGGTCHRYGGYVPDDLRGAFPNIDGRTFPLTENSISPSLKQQLVKQYQAANQPVSTQSHNCGENGCHFLPRLLKSRTQRTYEKREGSLPSFFPPRFKNSGKNVPKSFVQPNHSDS